MISLELNNVFWLNLMYCSIVAKCRVDMTLVSLYFGGIQQVLNSDFLKFRILEILKCHP